MATCRLSSLTIAVVFVDVGTIIEASTTEITALPQKSTPLLLICTVMFPSETVMKMQRACVEVIYSALPILHTNCGVSKKLEPVIVKDKLSDNLLKIEGETLKIQGGLSYL